MSFLLSHSWLSFFFALSGLAEVLAGCSLDGCLGAARAWCDAQGVDSLALLSEVGMVDDLVAALPGLKPAKAKQLSLRLARGYG